MMVVIVIVVMIFIFFDFFLRAAIHFITTTQMIKPKTKRKSFITREQNTGTDITITHTFQKGVVPSVIPLVVQQHTQLG